ncbi:conserved Plasmodium protein, unknown function [Plasmodium gaboni]|uniref:Mini-chromosome maintenance complex-binding protein n=1 Tax=Plasmodium gaboni TaxID=647221 RepID=A0ABY1UTA9_9APIC|nr:conserved Plasmodium protein, unknown function [Plasmodium gaboni]
MNVLNQIDECFSDYLKIYGSKEIDSHWDEGVVVNKYIKLGKAKDNNEAKENMNKEDNNNNNNMKEEMNKQNDPSEEKNGNYKNYSNDKIHINSIVKINENDKENDDSIYMAKNKKQKENLFICNELVEKCICLNKLESLEEIEDATLVRWTCMIQQIISPESYLGIYKLKNKESGKIIMKSSKYKDYIDAEDNWEIVEENEKRGMDEYYEFNINKQYENVDNKMDQTVDLLKNNEDVNKKNDEHNKKDEKSDPNKICSNEKNDITNNDTFGNIELYENDGNFNKYWKRYLFFCTNIPGNKSTWTKELYDYSSSYSNCELFLKSKNDYENGVYLKDVKNPMNNEDVNDSVASSTDISNYMNSNNNNNNSMSNIYSSREYISSSNELNETQNNDNNKDKNGYKKIDTSDKIINGKNNNTTNSNNNNNNYSNNYINSTDLDMHSNLSSNICSYNISPVNTSNKIRCVIKIYDDDSQYNGKNDKEFLKLNDVIEIIGIYRKHQIKDFEDYKKNYNFYFYYDQHFLKYPCIHIFQYKKINYFNPLNNCILFKNDLSMIISQGPFNDINKLRHHLIMYISSAFNNDMLVAHYFFFYLCGSYIKESKLKLGKISLNIFNILYNNEIEKLNDHSSSDHVKNDDMRKLQNKIQNDTHLENDVKKAKETNNNSFFHNDNNKVLLKEADKKGIAPHAKKLNKMIKNLIPLYRYIPLILQKLNTEYLVSVMNNQYGELKKGKLQLANNTYLTFDECLLDVGNLNNISIKNFQCIERLITSQEIPFIFNMDIIFQTEHNILILSKKKSMYAHYVDIAIPICHYNKIKHNSTDTNNELKNENIENVNCSTNNDEPSNSHNQKNEQTKDIFSSEFYNNVNNNYKPNEKELMQFRRYINYILSKNHSAKIPEDITNYITDTFVLLRQKNKDINQFVLNSWICMSRILAFSDGHNEINRDHWDYIMKLENERRLRLNNLNKIYI